MKCYVGMSQIMKDKVSSLKCMDKLQKEIMQEEELRRKSYENDYGGQLCIRIPRSIARNVMYVREQGNHHEAMSFP